MKNFRQYFCEPLFLASEMRLPPQTPLTVLAGIWGAELVGLTVGYFRMLLAQFTAEYQDKTILHSFLVVHYLLISQTKERSVLGDQDTELHRCHVICNTVHHPIVSCPLISGSVLQSRQ